MSLIVLMLFFIGVFLELIYNRLGDILKVLNKQFSSKPEPEYLSESERKGLDRRNEKLRQAENEEWMRRFGHK
jgi:hypothetical protein